jgi:hypothetical protein
MLMAAAADEPIKAATSMRERDMLAKEDEWTDCS